jgi:hypothetical protein
MSRELSSHRAGLSRLAIVRFQLQPVAKLMSASSPVNITELIDRYPLGPSQIKIIVLCGPVALFDGFDLLAIGVAGAAMAGPLHVAPRQFGFIFSATLFWPHAGCIWVWADRRSLRA